MKPQKLDLLPCPFRLYLRIENWTQLKLWPSLLQVSYRCTPLLDISWGSHMITVEVWLSDAWLAFCLLAQALCLFGAIGLHPSARERQKRKEHLNLFPWNLVAALCSSHGEIKPASATRLGLLLLEALVPRERTNCLTRISQVFQTCCWSVELK